MTAANRLAAAAIAVALATFAFVPTAQGAAEQERPRVKAPKSGTQYSGRTAQKRKLTLQMGGTSVGIVAFRFACGRAVANTSLTEIRLRKGRTGYRFRITSFGIVTYLDGRPDQNARIQISGRFSRDARRARGRLRVRVRGCDTGSFRWRVSR